MTFWQKLRGDPWFVGPTTAFGGALITELYEALQSGHFVWNLQSGRAMIVSAIGAAITSLYHLYQTPPPPTPPPASEKGTS
jgi:hypothetical protein